MRRPSKQRSFVAEALESRTMFNGADGPIVITGTDGPDKIDLYYGQLAGGNWIYNYNVNGIGKGLYDFDASKIVINAKGGDDKINIWSLPFAPTTISGGDGNDTINVTGVRQLYNMNIDGGAGSNTLNAALDLGWTNEVYNPSLIDSYDVTSTTLQRWFYDKSTTLTHPNAPITYANLQWINFMTSPGDATVNVRSTAAGCTTTIYGQAGKNTFNIGDGNLDANLLGHVSLHGQGGADTLNFNDFMDGGDDTYTLYAASLSKANASGGGIGGGADFIDIENIKLTANAGNNTIYVHSVSSYAAVNVNGWGGDDRFYIGNRNYAANISGKLNISGGGGANDQVQFNDQDDLGADSYTLSSGAFVKTGLSYPTTFSQVQVASVAGNTDANTFDVTPSSSTRFFTYGRNHGTVPGGDVLRLHVDNVISPTKTTSLSSIGYYRFGNRLPVTFNGVETQMLVGTPIMLTTLRINAGGGAFTDSQKQAWSADTGFTGGTKTVNAVAIDGTTDDALFASRRVGSNMTFSAAVKNGTYTLKLLMADPVFTVPGKRIFDVYAEGAKVLAGVDIVKEAGTKTALVKVLKVTVTDGKLDLAFKSIVDNATISGIELTPALLS